MNETATPKPGGFNFERVLVARYVTVDIAMWVMREYEFKRKIPCAGKVSKEHSSKEKRDGFYFSEVEVI